MLRRRGDGLSFHSASQLRYSGFSIAAKLTESCKMRGEHTSVSLDVQPYMQQCCVSAKGPSPLISAEFPDAVMRKRLVLLASPLLRTVRVDAVV